MTTIDRDRASEPTDATTSGGADAPPRTTLPDRRPPTALPERRRLTMIRGTDLLAVFGALAAALAITGLLWTQLTPFSGKLGWVVLTWVLFIVLYAVLVSFDESRPTMRDRVATVIMYSIALLLLAALVFVVFYTIVKGWRALVHSNFYTQDLNKAGPLDGLDKGGIEHAIVGTLIQVGIALVVAVPLGLLAAVFLQEVPGRFSRFVRTVVEAMTALPDIVAGLFIYATLIIAFGLEKSGLAAAIALAVTILPIITRAGDVVLRLVPGGLKEASYALGTGQWRTVWHVVLPTARSGLTTAVILGAARAIGETSPALLTAGFTATFNADPVHDPMVSLPLEAYSLTRSSSDNLVSRGFGSAAVLIVLVVLLFAIARAIGGRGAGQLSPRQLRRRASASQRDAARYDQRDAAPRPAYDSPLFNREETA